MMNLDLHTHGKLSKKTHFSLDYFAAMTAEAIDNGLNAIALTEHFNTLNYTDMLDQLDAAFAYQDDYYDVNGLKVFTGMEVDVAERGHILIIGNRLYLRDLRQQLEPYAEKGSFIPFSELMDRTEDAPVLRIGAHPMRESNPLTQYAAEQLRRLHALDINAKDLYQYGPAMADQVRQLAAEIGLPACAGSDSHQPLQFGSVWNVLERDCCTAAELREELQNGRYSVEISPCLSVKVKAAQMMKELLKKTMTVE
ncbi:PHP-associated domain-containing protein [Paenibacillus sp. BIHB 4019]|nr:PHP-associated domain-containing protein [Paenibacillus sp. BIHB 4019]